MKADLFRVAAVGDLHLTGAPEDDILVRELVDAANTKADVLALCGDLTAHGRPDELKALLDVSRELDVPAIAVLGNHDHESDRDGEFVDLLAAAGIDVLDGDPLVIDGIGFAGVKGFGGGFNAGLVSAFGERALKVFVEEGEQEADRLESALTALETDIKVVLMHYAPVSETLVGEPEWIWPFLGCSRFHKIIDRAAAKVVFHGHAHHGRPMAATPGGVAVYNVALPVLRRDSRAVRIWSTRRPSVNGRSVSSSSRVTSQSLGTT
jgi:Icc-related predicted phosphoesterase